MEKWASNTLRVLGIIFTAIALVLGSLLLLLLSVCAWGGGIGGGGVNRELALGYLLGVVALLVVAIFIIAKLGKAIARSSSMQPLPVVATNAEIPSVPLHPSSASLAAIQTLLYAIAAK